MNGKRLLRGTILTALCMAAMLYMNGMVSKAFWVVVKGDSTRIRNAASTKSEVMTTVKGGDRLEVVSEEQGSDGKVWYKVAINNVSGYVRSDTVNKEDEANGGAAAPAASASVVEAMASQAATVKTDNVNVRADASTNGKVVATLKGGAAVTLTGTTLDKNGKKWYQVNFINNGANVTGFIREDFVVPGEVMEPVAPPEEAPAEEPADPAPEAPAEGSAPNNDYELFFEADADGVNCWYIHDNVARKRYKLEQLMQAGELGVRNVEIKDKELSRMKLILIVLAVLLAAAVAVAVIFGYKYFDIRNDDGGDDDEDDDEEEDDDDDDDPRQTASVRRRERPEPERREALRREDRGAGAANRPDAGAQRRPVNNGGQRRPDGERQRAGGAQPARQRPDGEPQRRPSADEARARNAQPSGEARARSAQPSGEVRARSAQPSDEARARSAQPSDEARARGAQPATQGRRPQPPAENAARKNGRPDVEWKSKNFLAGEEDELDLSFINGDEE